MTTSSKFPLVSRRRALLTAAASLPVIGGYVDWVRRTGSIPRFDALYEDSIGERVPMNSSTGNIAFPKGFQTLPSHFYLVARNANFNILQRSTAFELFDALKERGVAVDNESMGDSVIFRVRGEHIDGFNTVYREWQSNLEAEAVLPR